jgi:hypothetical protein
MGSFMRASHIPVSDCSEYITPAMCRIQMPAMIHALLLAFRRRHFSRRSPSRKKDASRRICEKEVRNLDTGRPPPAGITRSKKEIASEEVRVSSSLFLVSVSAIYLSVHRRIELLQKASPVRVA